MIILKEWHIQRPSHYLSSMFYKRHSQFPVAILSVVVWSPSPFPANPHQYGLRCSTTMCFPNYTPALGNAFSPNGFPPTAPWPPPKGLPAGGCAVVCMGGTAAAQPVPGPDTGGLSNLIGTPGPRGAAFVGISSEIMSPKGSLIRRLYAC